MLSSFALVRLFWLRTAYIYLKAHKFEQCETLAPRDDRWGTTKLLDLGFFRTDFLFIVAITWDLRGGLGNVLAQSVIIMPGTRQFTNLQKRCG